MAFRSSGRKLVATGTMLKSSTEMGFPAKQKFAKNSCAYEDARPYSRASTSNRHTHSHQHLATDRFNTHEMGGMGYRQYHTHRVTTSICRSLCSATPHATKSTNDVNMSKDREHEEAWSALVNQTDAFSDESDARALGSLESLVKQLDPCGDSLDFRVAAACCKLAFLYSSAEKLEPSKSLSYAQRALKSYRSRGPSLQHVQCLYVSGFSYFHMQEFDRSIEQLEECALLLEQMKPMSSDKYLHNLKPEVQSIMGHASMHLGKPAEASSFFYKALQIKETMFNPGSPELGLPYLQLARALREAKDLDAATKFCSKAFTIYMNCYGPSSLQVAQARGLMSGIYHDLGKYEDALAEYETVRTILQHFNKSAPLDIETAESMVYLQKFEDAILRLEEVVQATEATCKDHVVALIMLARVCAVLKDENGYADYCKKVLAVLDNREASAETAAMLALLGNVYEVEQDFEQATRVYRKAKELFDQCPGRRAAVFAADIEGKIGHSLLHENKSEEALPYLERCLEKLKSIFGPEHGEQVVILNTLGVAYLQVGRLDEALKQYEDAKTIVFKAGDTPMRAFAYSNLASVYKASGRIADAIQSQKLAVDVLEKQKGAEVEMFLEEFKRQLKAYIEEAESSKKSTDRSFLESLVPAVVKNAVHTFRRLFRNTANKYATNQTRRGKGK